MVFLLKEILIKNSKIFHCLQFSNNTIFEVQFEKFQKKELEIISLLKGGTRGIDATIKNPKNFSHRFQFFKIVQFEKFQNFFFQQGKEVEVGLFIPKIPKIFNRFQPCF